MRVNLSERRLKTVLPHLASVPGLIGVEINVPDAAIARLLGSIRFGISQAHRIAWIREAIAPRKQP